MHKNATKCNKTQSKWCINKHGASKIIDTFEMYHRGTSELDEAMPGQNPNLGKGCVSSREETKVKFMLIERKSIERGVDEAQVQRWRQPEMAMTSKRQWWWLDVMGVRMRACEKGQDERVWAGAANPNGPSRVNHVWPD
jgi:hypothetical protein